MQTGKATRVVLVGGGHCHIQIIKGLNTNTRPEWLEVVVIDQQSHASYSGMVPGCVARVYKEEESKIDIGAVANWAKCPFYQEEVVDVDFEEKKVFFQSGGSLSYDLVSFDIGSSTRGATTLPGSHHLSPTRPISSLTSLIATHEKSLLHSLPPSPPVKAIVVGAGMSGIELSFSIHGRWKPLFPNLEIHLLDYFPRLLGGEEEVVRRAFEEQLAKRNIHHHRNVRVREVTEQKVVCEDGRCFVSSPGVVLWATGAEPHPIHGVLKKRGLALNDKGWINVSPTLQSTTHPTVFAAGDCANIHQEGCPSPPKAGVYAVRAGPTLQNNLLASLEGRDLEDFEPQKDFLKLVGCGDETALGVRWDLPFYGGWVWDLKCKIDSMFMDLFSPSLLPDVSSPDSTENVPTQYDSIVSLPPAPEDEGVAVERLREQGRGDYALCWAILRKMMREDEYKERVCALYREKLEE